MATFSFFRVRTWLGVDLVGIYGSRTLTRTTVHIRLGCGFGKDIGGTTIFQYYVKFKFFNGEKEITVKSNTVYTEEEAEYFKQTEKFLVKYKGKRAVISQLPE